MSTASVLRQIAMHRPFFVGLKKKKENSRNRLKSEKKDRLKRRILIVFNVDFYQQEKIDKMVFSWIENDNKING